MAYNRKAHLRDNIEAIRLMFRLEKERRAATPEELAALAAYSGFGGIKAVLSPFGRLTDILRWTQSDRELFPLVSELHGAGRRATANCSPSYRNCTACSARGRRMNVNTNGWWTA